MKNFLIKYKWKLTGMLIGAVAGYAYWYYIGCTSGTCPMQSNWHTSTLYGGLIGYIFPNSPNKKLKESQKEVKKLES